MNGNEITFHKVMRWTDEECRQFLVQQRWPEGVICPKCGHNEVYNIKRQNKSKNKVQHLFKCKKCRRQFTATVGTIFEDSHIPLNKWFAAIYLMCASKKGISAHQLHRQLDITYKSAWFMCHRVREAMKEKGFTLLKGTVEADETYIGGKKRGHWVWKERAQYEVQLGLRPKSPHPRINKEVVFGIKERDGRVRTVHVKNKKVTAKQMQAIVKKNVDVENAHLMTDANSAYRLIKDILPHDMIRHEESYVDGDIHTQGIEGYWSLLKRGLYGVFHHVDAEYLEQYLNEFEYRFNRRKITDAERFTELLAQTQGRVLWYCQKPQPENPHA